MSSPNRPLHIGIFCDYGTTLRPVAGIGVFVYNLVDAMLQLDPAPRITLQIHPGEHQQLKTLTAKWGSRVRLFSPKGWGWILFARLNSFLTRMEAVGDWNGAYLDSLRHWVVQGVQRRVKDMIKRELEAYSSQRNKALRILRALVGGSMFAALGAAGWLEAISYHLCFDFLFPTFRFPLRMARVAFERIVSKSECDVWLVPHASTPVSMKNPSVLVIFDLVYRHVPEVFSRERREHFEQLMRARAREASFIFCGSEFVRDHDLVPTLPFMSNRIRVFKLAPPVEENTQTQELDLAALQRKFNIGSRYMFYPAAIRPHKNHPILLRALSLLRAVYGEADLELVCTGEPEGIPGLRQQVDYERLASCVHLLGSLPREDVVALYRHAQIAPLPSFHEGYGLPVLEALQFGCPIACADIPAFRELLDGGWESVAFFNPWDPHSIAKAVKATLVQRDRIRARQLETFHGISSRDWKAVAQDFLGLFQEAQERAAFPSPQDIIVALPEIPKVTGHAA